MNPLAFDKYQKHGAYHWSECEARLSNHLTFNPPLVARYEVVVDQVAALRPQRVIDVGCGDGYLLGRLSGIAPELVGVEADGSGIRHAREQLADRRNCRLIHGSCYALPIAARTVDVAISTDVIEHLTDPALHLSEMARVLKSDGALLLTTPRRLLDRPINEYHVTEYEPGELEALLRAHFRAVELRYHCPRRWARLYATRLGWRAIKLLAILFYNPFLGKSGRNPAAFTQIAAVCRGPLH